MNTRKTRISYSLVPLSYWGETHLLFNKIYSSVLMKYGIRVKHTGDPNLLLKEDTLLLHLLLTLL